MPSRRFPGSSGNYMTIPSAGAYNRSFSVAGWVRRQATGAVHALCGLGADGWLFRIDSTNQLQFLDSNSAGLGSGSSTLSSTGVWYHVGVVVSSGSTATATFYLNGVADGTTAGFTNTLTPGNAGGLLFGADKGFGQGSPNSSWLDADLALWGVWGAELTAGEMLTLAKGTAPWKIRHGSIDVAIPFGLYSGTEVDFGFNHRSPVITGTLSAVHASPPVSPFRFGVPH